MKLYVHRRKRKHEVCDACGFERECHILSHDGLPALCEEPEDAELCVMRESGVLKAYKELRAQYLAKHKPRVDKRSKQTNNMKGVMSKDESYPVNTRAVLPEVRC